jgi:hypothetical protein
MRWRIAVFGTLGAAATIVGAIFVLAPGLVLGIPPVRMAVSSVTTGPKAVMTGAAAIVGLYVLAAARSRSATQVPADTAAEQRFDAAATNPPEAVTADQRSLTGAGLDADVEFAIADGDRPLRAVRDVLRDLAVDAYTDDPRRTDEARRAVETGAWTNDPHAAVFLAGEDGPTPSLLSRVRLWLSPERERERRIEATVRAIERRREER